LSCKMAFTETWGKPSLLPRFSKKACLLKGDPLASRQVSKIVKNHQVRLIFPPRIRRAQDKKPFQKPHCTQITLAATYMPACRISKGGPDTSLSELAGRRQAMHHLAWILKIQKRFPCSVGWGKPPRLSAHFLSKTCSKFKGAA